ncbi:hypothetical protein SCHPADRAFT_651781 [Schizopora paradoxa]|uniref:Uncharacterized protein n=1 Tax=Schizopora paradoxa TaxID=27342 RepID=A0A0H2R6C6_9AGAM|nr:hypothetical protein SCHPADRAFT_651781 [Schizopora paradoxa]
MTRGYSAGEIAKARILGASTREEAARNNCARTMIMMSTHPFSRSPSPSSPRCSWRVDCEEKLKGGARRFGARCSTASLAGCRYVAIGHGLRTTGWGMAHVQVLVE